MRTPEEAILSLSPYLLPGERVVWSGQHGDSPPETGFNLFMWSFASLLAWAAIHGHPLPAPWSWGLALLTAAFWLTITLALADDLNAVCSGVLVGDRHLLVRVWLTTRTIPLSTIRSSRLLSTKRTTRGTSSIETHKVELTLDGGSVVTLGPVYGGDQLAEMLEGIRSGAIVPAALRSVTGDLAEAERSPRLVFVPQTTGLGLRPCSLVMTPRWLVLLWFRLTDAQQARLATLLASPDPIELIEERLLSFALEARESRVIDRSLHTVRVAGAQLMVESLSGDASGPGAAGYREPAARWTPPRESLLSLEPEAAKRVRSFLRRAT